MKYIYIIGSWFGFKRPHSKISAGIVSGFLKAVTELEELEQEVQKTMVENRTEIDKKLAHNAELAQLSEKNAKVASNIRALVGE